jgi:gluconokinase
MEGLPKEAIVFVLLDGSRELIAERLAGRQNHYMNPTLLDSQLATLETPPDALRVVNDRQPEDVVNEIMQHLELHEEK